MEYTEEFTNIRNNIILEHLQYKRKFIKDETELNLIDLKIKSILDTKSDLSQNNKNEEFDFLSKIESEVNKYSLFRAWTRLTKEQKLSQTKLYLDNLIEAENINHIKEVVLQYVDTGILTNKHIKYDSKCGKVITIEPLKYDNETNTYDIQIKLKKTLSI